MGIDPISLNDVVGDDIVDGEIIVFQLDVFHPHLKLIAQPNIDTVSALVALQPYQIRYEEDYETMESKLRVQIHRKNKKGKFWYFKFDEFTESLLSMTTVKVSAKDMEAHILWSKAF